MSTEDISQEAFDEWQKQLQEEIAQRANSGSDLPIPDLDDMMFTPEFLEADVALALSFITSTMKAVRKTKNWKSSDLKIYKDWRQKLLVEHQKVKGLVGLPEELIKASQEVLKQFYAEVAKPK